MLFNSIDFFIFLPIVFLLYWFVVNRNLKLQNLFLLIVSYVFYAWWDYRFLSLIALSTIVDYFVGLKIHGNQHARGKKKWLYFSMFFNLGLLGFFKYYNFFIESWIDLLNSVGYTVENTLALEIILPVGISFYTFQTMSYSLDIKKGQLEPTKDFIAFATFVAFFPQLVAGPIERASNLLPQFFKKRKFSYNIATDGARQITWGLFKKIVIADNCAPFVNDVFANYDSFSGLTLIFAVVLFAFQIYADFSGYTDVAIGVAKLLGFDFKRNFNYPYFSTNISDFWKRWHISLSSWLNDYVFTPLAINFRNYRKRGIFLAVFITFILSGLWHGAGWNFIVWGGLHGLFYLPIIFSKKRFTAISTNKNLKKNSATLKDLHKMVLTFILVCITYIFFRAESLGHALSFIGAIFDYGSLSDWFRFKIPKEKIILLLIPAMLITEWLQRDKNHGLCLKDIKIAPLRAMIYIIVFVLLLLFGASSSPFIYFQF